MRNYPKESGTSRNFLFFFITLAAASCQVDSAEVLSTNVPTPTATAQPEKTLHPVSAAGKRFPADAVPVCTATPTGWQPAPLKDEPGVLDGTCKLTSITVDSFNDGVPESVTTYEHSPSKTVVHYKNGTRTYLRDAQGRVVGRIIEQSYGKHVYTDKRVLDAKGRLLSNETRSKHANKITEYVHRVTQTWDGDLLLSRNEWRSGTGDTFSTTWTYDSAGRMLTATRRVSNKHKVAATASWTYDGAGRPISLIRTLHGKTSMVASWRWHSDGRLRGRDVTVTTGLGGITGGPLDSMDTPTGSVSGNCYGCSYVAKGPAWQDALMVEKDGCRTLPIAVGHGYPEADYQLVDAEQEDAMATAGHVGHSFYSPYAYSYYGYGYGGQTGGFQGHMGAGGNWDALALKVAHKQARFSIDYDAQGRMVRERMDVVHAKDAPGVPTSLLRRRVFGEKGLLRDVVERNGTVLRSIVMQRDARGSLVRRELRIDGAVAEGDAWERDARGMPVVRARLGQKKAWEVMQLTSKEEVPGPTLATVFRRAWDDEGRMTQLQIERMGADGSQVVHGMQEWFSYDEEGRLVGRAQGPVGKQATSVETWKLDGEGRQVEHSRRYPGIQTAGAWHASTTWNAEGMKVRSLRANGQSKAANWSETRDYDCSATQ